jgi:hypothetical protein
VEKVKLIKVDGRRKIRGPLSSKNKIILILTLMLFSIFLMKNKFVLSFERIICSFPNSSLIFKLTGWYSSQYIWNCVVTLLLYFFFLNMLFYNLSATITLLLPNVCSRTGNPWDWYCIYHNNTSPEGILVGFHNLISCIMIMLCILEFGPLHPASA